MTTVAQESPALPKLLLAHYLRQLKLPTVLREYEKGVAEAAREDQDHVRYLLRLARTPWEASIKTVPRLTRRTHRCNAATGLWTTTRETVFRVSSAPGFSARQWNVWIRGHWRIENGSRYVRDMTFVEDASRIRKNPDIAARLLRSFAYNLLRADGAENIKNARWRASLDLDYLLGIIRKY